MQMGTCYSVCVCGGGYNSGSAGVAEIKIHILKAVSTMAKERVGRGG